MSATVDPRAVAAPHDIHPAETPGHLVKAGAEPVLKATRIAKWFGDNHVLRGASITVWPGETICILGRSGSGKSTFLRSLNFLEEPTDGRVEIDGVVVDADPFHTQGEARQAQIQQARLRAGMVFQEFNLFPHLSVIGNCVEAPVHVKGMDRKEAEAIAEKYLEKVGLSDKRDEYPSRLSGGQRQRVAIARALANDPPLIVADEPTGNLDSATADAVFTLFEKMVAQGRTILMVTHDNDLARRVQRAVHVSDGRIVSDHG